MTLEQAQKILNFIQAYANENNLHLAAAVTDSHGELISFFKMDNCSLQSGVLALTKPIPPHESANQVVTSANGLKKPARIWATGRTLSSQVWVVECQ